MEMINPVMVFNDIRDLIALSGRGVEYWYDADQMVWDWGFQISGINGEFVTDEDSDVTYFRLNDDAPKPIVMLIDYINTYCYNYDVVHCNGQYYFLIVNA
jgi:hypothetical protein